MKALIDTNLIIDIACNRQPFIEEAKAIFCRMDGQKLQGYVSASAITDIFYLLRKSKGEEPAFEFLKALLKVVHVLEVNEKTIQAALTSRRKDFEDAVQIEAAAQNGIDIIITRDGKGFKDAPIPVFTPREYLERL